MLKAIGSKKNLLELPFYGYISDIFENEEIQKLADYTHHIYTTRLQHSLNVSYYNYIICKFLGLNAISAARAGLLHDMFFYNRKDHSKKFYKKSHSAYHPEIAVENAKSYFYLDPLECDIIEKHMWPANISRVPKYKETYIIVFVDKYCAILEFFAPKYHKIKNIFSKKSVK